MKRKDRVNLIKLIISLSFVVIFSGIAFDFNNNKKLINPELDTYVLSSNKDKNGTISITTVDNKDKDSKKNTAIAGNKSTNNVNNSQGSNISGNNSSNNNTVVIDANDQLRRNIQNKYGISVKYGTETNGYTVSNLSVISLSDDNSIKLSLNQLDKNLSYYPSNLFKEMKNSGFNLTIYLIRKYSVDNVTGITDSTNKNVIISLAAEYQFKESVHHELYHYMERYMYSKGVRYTTWNSLNPSGFKYGNTNSSLSFNNTGSANAYFVNNYAQTSAEEDRASTFEYMTADSRTVCLYNGRPIWLKAKYMSEQIDIAFATVNANTIEYWERFVY
ncbi:MAG: hypothetical protein IJF92_05725 [Bacilli bacterium]|nr:hypothetical protein [Bacilli bacterium]